MSSIYLHSISNNWKSELSSLIYVSHLSKTLSENQNKDNKKAPFLSAFSRIKELGRGGFSTVYLGK